LGNKLDIPTFCKSFDLDDNIGKKLLDNGYWSTQTFIHIKEEQLEKMGFLLGEIAELKVTVREWAVEE
jgi:hypothetical protein